MSINLTDEIEVKTKKGKLGAAKQIFLEGDTQTVEKEIQDINSRHNDLNSKHESLSSTVSEHTNQIESNQSQITANKSAQDAKNISLDANMAKLNTRDDQITELVRGITVTGGASVATAVTYDNTSSHLTSATVQGAIDELQDAIADETTRATAADEAAVLKNKEQDQKISELSSKITEFGKMIKGNLQMDVEYNVNIESGTPISVYFEASYGVALRFYNENTYVTQSVVPEGQTFVREVITPNNSITKIVPTYANLQNAVIDWRYDAKSVDSRLMGEIESVDSRLMGEIESVDSRFMGKIDKINLKIGVLDIGIWTQDKEYVVDIKEGITVSVYFEGEYGQALRFYNGGTMVEQIVIAQGDTSAQKTFVPTSDINTIVAKFGDLKNVSVKFTYDAQENIKKLNTSVDELKTFNKMSVGELHDNFINSTHGEEIPATSYKCTDFVRLNAVEIGVISTSKSANVGLAFYDSNKRYISGKDFADVDYGTFVTINVPANAVYFRTCAINKQASNIAVYNTSVASSLNRCVVNSGNPCFYTESEEARVFNKVLFIGDSLTDGQFDYHDGDAIREVNKREYSVPTFFAAISGRQTTNKGDAGETTKTWWELHGTEDFSGHDAALIALGRNDYVTGRETTPQERALYMGNIINKLKQDNSQIKIFIATMINYYKGEAADAVNESMRSIAEATEDCYLVDISKYGKLVSHVDNLSHCTAVGYSKIARYYFNYISWIMSNNPTEFKYVQYAGTNLSW